MAKASNGKNGRKPATPKSAPTSASNKPPVAVAPPVAPHVEGDLEDQIRQRAYELYLEEGQQEGRDQEYWLRAEAEIRGRRTA